MVTFIIDGFLLKKKKILIWSVNLVFNNPIVGKLDNNF